MADATEALLEEVRQAIDQGRPLAPTGGGTKAFYGREIDASPLGVAEHRGIVHYEPSELVATVRAGTPLAELEAELAEAGQMLPFEPPHFGPSATVGGAVASGLSGPRRPYAGAVRDAVLGVRLINGHGQPAQFGGEVMKNVAGYDVSRLMAGCMGTLGVILEVSVRLLPRPRHELTLVQEANQGEALGRLARWARRPLPITASCHDAGRLYIRLSGAEQAVDTAAQRLGGEAVTDADAWWAGLREQTLAFFDDPRPLWRLSLPPATPPLDLPGPTLMEWGGALRWLPNDAPAHRVREITTAAGGHATLFRGGDRRGTVFHPLDAGLHRLQRNLKQALDPHGILSPGRLYPDI